MRAARPLPKSTPAPAMLSWSAGSVAISVASPGIGLEALRASMTGRDACPTIENDAVVQIVWHGFRPLRSVPRVPLGSRSAWKSDAIDSLMPEETPARLGLRQRVFLAPAAEIRGPRRFCQPLLSAVICASFSTRRKLPKALWEKEFNASTLKNHPHDFKKTPFLFNYPVPRNLAQGRYWARNWVGITLERATTSCWAPWALSKRSRP